MQDERTVENLREKLHRINPFNELFVDLVWALNRIEKLEEEVESLELETGRRTL